MSKDNRRKLVAELAIKDWEKYYHHTMDNNIGFHITSNKSISKKNNKRERDINGIYSAHYGTTWGSEEAFSDKYTCECKESMGKEHEGELCPICHTEIIYRDANLKVTGWIVLEKDRLIHPAMFPLITSLIGMRALKAILTSKLETDIKGRYKTLDFEEIKHSKNINKYDGIGLVNFMIHYDDIIKFFADKKGEKKQDVYEFLVKHKDKTFVRHIPIYSVFLRPVTITGEKMSYYDINAKIENLASRCYRLNNKENRKIMNLNNYYKTIEAAQEKLIEIHDQIEATLKGKKGDFRSKIYGGRQNFTARMVIIPLSGTKIDEVELPYLGMLTLFKPEILNLLMKMGDLTMYEALYIWNRANIVFDSRVYEIMNLLITKNRCCVGINRNPTIEYGSILTMRIAKVSKNIEDMCLCIPLNILSHIAGDFDGDVLNIIAYKGKKNIAAAELTFNPRYNFQISTVDGGFNGRSALIKDQMVALHYFAAIDGEYKYNTELDLD